MSAFGTFLGSMIVVAGIFFNTWVTWVFMPIYLPMLWYAVFGLWGGYNLGMLNSRKAKKGNNTWYVAEASTAFALILFLSLYYMIIAPGKISIVSEPPFPITEIAAVVFAAGSGIAILLGLGLVVSNSVGEN